MRSKDLLELIETLLDEQGTPVEEITAEMNCGTIWITHENDIYALSLELTENDYQ